MFNFLMHSQQNEFIQASPF